MRTLKFISVLVLLPFLTNAQNTPETFIETFFSRYEKSPDEALDFIFATNKWMQDSQTGIDDLKYKLKGTLGLVGDYYGHNLITSKSVGEDLKLYTYIVKYDRQPLRFMFIFYRPSDKWQLQNFKFDDNLNAELEEAATLYRLKENIDY